MVILGRDGVVNRDDQGFVTTPEQWRPIDGSLEAIARLNQAGCQVVVATNQPELARGLFHIDALNAIHQRLRSQLDRLGGHLDGIFFCPHRPSDNCPCRKPRPGMLEQIRERFHLDLGEAVMIGDRRHDLEAAQAVGVRFLLVLTGRGRETREQLPATARTPVFRDLAEASRAILSGAIETERSDDNLAPDPH